MVLTGQSIAGMTLIPGTYTFALPADTITLEIDNNNVPEPASLALMLGGLAAAGLTARRRPRA
jgi:hypothetical protein